MLQFVKNDNVICVIAPYVYKMSTEAVSNNTTSLQMSP